MLKEISDYDIKISINKLLDELTKVKKVTTFFGDLKRPEKVESYTNGGKIADKIESIYHLKDKYS